MGCTEDVPAGFADFKGWNLQNNRVALERVTGSRRRCAASEYRFIGDRRFNRELYFLGSVDIAEPDVCNKWPNCNRDLRNRYRIYDPMKEMLVMGRADHNVVTMTRQLLVGVSAEPRVAFDFFFAMCLSHVAPIARQAVAPHPSTLPHGPNQRVRKRDRVKVRRRGRFSSIRNPFKRPP